VGVGVGVCVCVCVNTYNRQRRNVQYKRQVAEEHVYVISTVIAECTTLFVGEYQPNITAKISVGIKRKHLDGITRNNLLHSISTN